tara:strand:+ start:400 stop:819 length:420 start_codon:yes stop_codon:yes gene_type:complete
MKRGIVIGSFDILHPGYIRMFNLTRQHCDHLTVALHLDPSVDRSEKLSPVLPLIDRMMALLALKAVEEVKPYRTESDLLDILSEGKFDVRFMGDDYINKDYTGKELNIPVEIVSRSHGWSTTKIKNKIYDQINEHKNTK